jgi:hypothetical protein
VKRGERWMRWNDYRDSVLVCEVGKPGCGGRSEEKG